MADVQLWWSSLVAIGQETTPVLILDDNEDYCVTEKITNLSSAKASAAAPYFGTDDAWVACIALATGGDVDLKVETDDATPSLTSGAVRTMRAKDGAYFSFAMRPGKHVIAKNAG